ncbi:hypothetical protein [Spartinivicinus ruber]|uniref:hypothetical protein n=1 Tax=Spartinivicinus ruber TaxID=2683272 RepID=UPI0013D1B63A|nr:hypothetical protein [Spartinivicinus ruber]
MKLDLKSIFVIPLLMSSLYTFADGTTKNLNIILSQDEVKFLKENKLNMVIAKAVNSGGAEKYNVVWESRSDYAITNTYSWIPQYTANTTSIDIISPTSKVVAQGVNVPMKLGQKTILNQYGMLSQNVSKSDNPNSIEFDIAQNFYEKSFHITLATGLNSSTKPQPFFIDTETYEPGYKVEVTPIEKVKVWFQTELETGNYIEKIIAPELTVDFTNQSDSTYKYDNGKWSPVPDSELIDWKANSDFIPNPIMIAVATGVFVSISDLALKINTMLTGVESSVRATATLDTDKKVTVKFFYKKPSDVLESARLATDINSEKLDSVLLSVLSDSLAGLNSGFEILSAKVSDANHLYSIKHAESLFFWSQGGAHIFRKNPKLCEDDSLVNLVYTVKGRDYITQECNFGPQ